MAEDVEETLYQVTCRRPTWPFEDWRYEVFTKCMATVPSTGKGSPVWYTEDECQTIAEILKVDSVNEDYPFRKERLSAVLQKALKLSTKNTEKSTKSRLSDSARDIYSLDKVALGKKFFHVLVNMTLPEFSDETLALRVDILEILRGTGEYLQENCDLFNKCKIVPTGGMADGSKVYLTEDVDFLITLPALVETIEHVEICDESDLIPVLHLTLNEEKREVNLLKRLHTDFEAALDKSLKAGWKLDSVSSSLEGRTCQIILMVGQEDSADIKVTFNVCFVLPINRQNLSTSWDESHPDKITKVPLQNYTLSYLRDRDSQIFAILFQDELKSCSVSLDADMTSVLNNDFKGTGVAHTFQLAKRTIAIFFPHVFQDKTWKTMVPSHVILNIVMYLCAYRKNAKLWAPSRLHERLVEVLLLLERCAEDEAVNLFLLPGMAALPLYTSNAYYYDPEKSSFLSQDEVYTNETFHCRILDKGVLSAFSKHADITTYLVPYFSKMRNNEWTFPDQIGDLVIMLEEIFQCPVPRMWRDGRMSSIETDSSLLPPPKEKRRVSVRQAQQKANAAKSAKPNPFVKSTNPIPKRPQSVHSSVSSKSSRSKLKIPTKNTIPPNTTNKPSPKPSPSQPKGETPPPTTTTEQGNSTIANSNTRPTANGKTRSGTKRLPRGKDCCPLQ
ncbi:uncharacterized protein LOC135477111 [Liolophura sinensis]|uniref:uncharacterized protein LOC135477111 n=1 Tax=Liolophura sinensis TaxID=3198878 RepID=UPI0031584EBC